MQFSGLLDLAELETTLLAEGMTIPALGTVADQVFTYDGDGAIVDLPPEAQPFVDANTNRHRYDPDVVLAEVARLREAARLRADYERLAVLFRAVAGAPDLAAAVEAATTALIDVLKRRDRAAGLY